MSERILIYQQKEIVPPRGWLWRYRLTLGIIAALIGPLLTLPGWIYLFAPDLAYPNLRNITRAALLLGCVPILFGPMASWAFLTDNKRTTSVWGWLLIFCPWFDMAAAVYVMVRSSVRYTLF